MTQPPVVALLYPLLLAVLSSSAPAQTSPREARVYRCGPEGRQLQDSPCADKASAPAQAVRFDQPSGSQQRAAQQQALEIERQADMMERERLRSEAAQRKQQAGPGRIDGLARPAPVSASAPAQKAVKALPQRKKAPHPAQGASAPR
ncbi:hypothetical protein [Pelomonas sp. SE-A7]|uniref:hypothetical protein n=1 Tax=Pelomonas sp. SE-A7 TaxID=3054953 RepID=UPI00259C80DB|nr:hypothetical protein [Pelomonas sp. SE-A7]MDM4766391.1 hypothetical protein [Pelomonas sp. SE-A7]